MSVSSRFSMITIGIRAAARGSTIVAAGGALALLAGCGGETEEVAGDALAIIGSSTIYPFAQKVAEDLKAANPDLATAVIESTGSGEGIETFCAGQGPETADIVNSSRRMTVEEFNRCTSNGVNGIIEIEVGRDGIAFASALEEGIDLNLTRANVYRAISAMPNGQSQASLNWSDVDGALPAEPIIVYGPPGSSGTRDALLDLVLEPGCKTNPAMAALESSDEAAYERNCHALRSDSSYIDQGEQDDLIVRKVASNPRAVGVFGYSYLQKNAGSVKALKLDGVLPTAATIADGTYPASRPLYIYVKKAHIGVTPGLEQYLAQWAKSWGADGALAKIGLVASTAETQSKSAAAIEAKTVLAAADFE